MDSEESVTSVDKKFTAGQNNHQHTGKCPNGQFATEPVSINVSELLTFNQKFSSLFDKNVGFMGAGFVLYTFIGSC